MQTWIEQALARLPDRPFADLAPVGLWPLELVDVVGIEVPLPEGRPVSLHLRLVPTTLQSVDLGVLAGADPLRRLRRALASGLVGTECGVVMDRAIGSPGCATLYAGVTGGASWEQVEALRQALGGPARCAASRRLAAPVTHVGVMPSRPGHPVRYVLLAPPGQGAVDVLVELGVSKPAVRQARAALDSFPVGGRRYLNVDVVDGAIGPVVGLEHKPDPGDERDRAAVVLGWLVDHAEVSAADLEGMRGWDGRSLLTADGRPATAVDAAHLLAGGAGLVEHRRINHVKVTVGARREVKVYLSCARRPARAVPAR